MDAQAVIATVALLLSMLTFLTTQIGIRKTYKSGYVQDLEAKIKTCSEKNAHLEERIADLETREMRLMRRIFELEKP